MTSTETVRIITVQVQRCFTSTENIRTIISIRDGEPRTATSTFTQLLNSWAAGVQCCLTSTETVRIITVQVQRCFTSTENIRTIISIRDGEPRTATSTFTQLLNSWAAGVQCCLTSTETVRIITVQVQRCFTSTENIRTIISIRDGEPRTATSTFTQLLNSGTAGVQCCLTSTETVRIITVQVQRCFTSTENIRTIISIRDGEPRTATSTFTQLLSSGSSSSVLPHVHRNNKDN